MADYNNPYKTMVMVDPNVDPTLAFQIPVPEDFYEPGTLWKLTVAGTTSMSSSGIFTRTIKIGDIELARMQGEVRGPYLTAFYDEVLVCMYRDNLFDVQSKGITSTGPVSQLNTETNLPDPQPAATSSCASYRESPDVDRSRPTIDIYLFLAPIRSRQTVMLNAINLTRIG